MNLSRTYGVVIIAVRLFLVVTLISAQAQNSQNHTLNVPGNLQEIATFSTQNRNWRDETNQKNGVSQIDKQIQTKALHDLFVRRGEHMWKISESHNQTKNIFLRSEDHKKVLKMRGSIATLLKQDLDKGSTNKLNIKRLDKQRHRRARRSMRRHRELDPVPAKEPSIVVHANWTTFCDETTKPCPPQDANSTEQENEDFVETLSEIPHIDAEQEITIAENLTLNLLGELKYYVQNSELLKQVEDEKDASLDIDKIAYLVHEISNLAEKRPAGHEEFNVPSSQALTTQTIPTTPSPDALEQEIVDKMKVDSNLDVSIMGNSAKEMGNQMGKIPSNVAQSHDFATTTITTLENSGSESTSVEQNTENTSPAQPLENSAQSTLTENTENVEIISTNSTSIDNNSESSQSQPTDINPLDIAVDKIDLSSLSYLEETHDMARINEEHEKHKAKMIQLIRTLNITGQADEDRRRVGQIEEQVDAIEKEHQNLMRLKMQYRENFHSHRGHRRNHRQRHPHRQYNNYEPMIYSTNNDIQEQESVGNGRAQNSEREQYSSDINGVNDWQIEISTGPPAAELIQNSPDLNVDSGTVGPEVNFNGGFDESVDELKRKYPQGFWPKEVDSRVGSSNIAQKVQKIVDQNPELRPRPLPINIIFDKDYESEIGPEDLNTNRVEMTKRDLQESSFNSDEDKLSPENLEEIIKAERKANGPKKDHHIQEHDAKTKLLRNVESTHNLRKRQRPHK